MRKALWALPILLLSSAAIAQTPTPIPRQHPVLIQPAPQPTPTPTPLPNPPDGLYAGQVSGQIAGGQYNGTFNLGRWTVAIASQRCSDCDVGQYRFGGTYQGMTYSSGPQEAGGLIGYVNPSGNVISSSLLATNCAALNPSGNVYPAPGFFLTGFYETGENGYNAGPTLTLHYEDDFGTTIRVLAGNISGRDCFGQQITAQVRLVKQ